MKRGLLPISLYWLFYMAGLGVIFPYLSLYLQDNLGLSGTRLGVALAMHPLMGIIASPLWGQWADRSGHRRGVLIFLACGAALGYFLVPYTNGYTALLVSLAFLSAFTAPSMAVASSITFAVLGDGGRQRFGKVRVWGTIGYLVMIVAFPHLLTVIGEHRAILGGNNQLAVIFPIAAIMCAVASMTLLGVPSSEAMTVRAHREDLLILLRQPAYLRLLWMAFFAFALLTCPIALFPVFVTGRGGSVETVSHLWIPMLLLEVPLIYYAGAGLRRVGARGLIAAGIALDGARWLITVLVPNLLVIFSIQLLHGAVVVGLIIGMQLYVEGEVSARLRSTGQTVLGAVMSIGAVVSHLWGGAALEHWGANAPYLIAGPLSIGLGLFAWFYLKRQVGAGTD